SVKGPFADYCHLLTFIDILRKKNAPREGIICHQLGPNAPQMRQGCWPNEAARQPERADDIPLPLFESRIEKPTLHRTRQQALSNPVPARMERTGLDHLASLFGSCSLLS